MDLQQICNLTEPGDKSNKGAGTPSECKPTVSMVRGGIACAGDTLFEDNFDELNEQNWQIEQFIPINNPVSIFK